VPAGSGTAALGTNGVAFPSSAGDPRAPARRDTGPAPGA